MKENALPCCIITTLYCNWTALEKMDSFKWFLCNDRDAPACRCLQQHQQPVGSKNLLFQWLLTQRCVSPWGPHNCQSLSLSHYWRLTLPGQRWRLCVSLQTCLGWLNSMPQIFLWTKGVVSCGTTERFFCRKNMRLFNNRSPDDIVDLRMTLLSCRAAVTGQSMKPSGIHLFTAWASVRFTSFNA